MGRDSSANVSGQEPEIENLLYFRTGETITEYLSPAETSDPRESAPAKDRANMSDITREEVSARLEAVEARLDAKLAGIDSKLDTLLTKVDVASSAAARAEGAADRAREASQSIKWNIVFTALSVVAIMLAAWALWAQGIEMITSILGEVHKDAAISKP